MSKYEELLWKAVARLPRDRPDLRRDVYERARAALRKQLHDTEPPIGDLNIAAEERALNEAIARIETAPTDEAGAPSAAGTQQRAGGSGRLSELLKRASRDVALALVPKPYLPPLSSPLDFAPRRAQAEPRPAAPKPTIVATPAASETSKPQRTPDVSGLVGILRKLQEESPGVEASAIISEDGAMIASALAADIAEARIAGMAATLQNVGARASLALSRGKTQEVVIRGDSGYAILIRARDNMLLLALADASSKLGLIFFNMHEAIKALPDMQPDSVAPDESNPSAR